jgi:hypothetical protein
MVQVPPSSSNLGTQYFDEHMSPAVDRRLSLVIQANSSTDAALSTTLSSEDSTQTLPDVFHVTGPMGPPITVQQEIDDLDNSLQYIIFSYGAILNTWFAAPSRVPRSLKKAKSLPDGPEWKIPHERNLTPLSPKAHSYGYKFCLIPIFIAVIANAVFYKLHRLVSLSRRLKILHARLQTSIHSHQQWSPIFPH